MANLPSKLDGARAKIKAAFAKAGVTYPTMLYRAKAHTGANPARGITGTQTNTDTALQGAYFRVASLGEVARAGGLIQEGSVILEQVTLTLTKGQLEAARDPSKAVLVVDGVEFRVVSYKPEPAESPLWWTVTCNKAGP